MISQIIVTFQVNTKKMVKKNVSEEIQSTEGGLRYLCFYRTP